MSQPAEEFQTGKFVPASGIYSVMHAAHRLAAEVALLKEEKFPRCAHCSSAVIFRLMRVFPGLDAMGTPSCRTPLHEMATLDSEANEPVFPDR